MFRILGSIPIFFNQPAKQGTPKSTRISSTFQNVAHVRYGKAIHHKLDTVFNKSSIGSILHPSAAIRQRTFHAMQLSF